MIRKARLVEFYDQGSGAEWTHCTAEEPIQENMPWALAFHSEAERDAAAKSIETFRELRLEAEKMRKERDSALAAFKEKRMAGKFKRPPSYYKSRIRRRIKYLRDLLENDNRRGSEFDRGEAIALEWAMSKIQELEGTTGAYAEMLVGLASGTVSPDDIRELLVKAFVEQEVEGEST